MRARKGWCVRCVCVLGERWWSGLIYLQGYYYFWQTRDGKCINRLKLCGFSRDALYPVFCLPMFWGNGVWAKFRWKEIFGGKIRITLFNIITPVHCNFFASKDPLQFQLVSTHFNLMFCTTPHYDFPWCLAPHTKKSLWRMSSGLAYFFVSVSYWHVDDFLLIRYQQP